MTFTAIRRATLDDLELVAPLFDAYRRFYGKPGNLGEATAFLRARLENDESVILVAHGNSGDNGAATGFAQLYPSFSSVSAARIYVLNDLYVSPAARRQGVAAGLLRAAADFGRQAGAIRLALSTGVDNKSAQALYEGAGWQRDDAFYHYELPLHP